jgi:IS5 family transposase
LEWQWETEMARRRIGQEAFGFAQADERGRKAGLDELASVLDWTRVERALAGIYAAAKGEAAWPPLARFKALLLGVLYDLSDVRLAEALDDPQPALTQRNPRSGLKLVQATRQ